MSDAFNTAFKDLIGLEGNFSNDENDPGNWTGGAVNNGTLKGTKYGISAAAYPNEDIVNLQLSRAQTLYQQDYWDKMKCDALPTEVAIALFKEGVNLGCEGAIKCLQNSLKVTPDGIMGQLTIGCATRISEIEVVIGFLTQCAYAYTQMANFKIDGKGWLSRVIKTAVESAA
jgi:lysozyme family protein